MYSSLNSLKLFKNDYTLAHFKDYVKDFFFCLKYNQTTVIFFVRVLYVDVDLRSSRKMPSLMHTS